MNMFQVVVMEPGDRFVTRREARINTPDEKRTLVTLQHWQINAVGDPVLTNPPQEDVAALFGGPS